MSNETGQLFESLKKDISAYVELRLQLLKLNTYERTGRVVGILSYGLILLFLAFFATLFIFIALGFFLGDLYNSPAAGFGTVALLYAILAGVVVSNKERIRSAILNAVIAALTGNEDKTNNEKNETNPTDSDREADGGQTTA